MDVEGSLEIAEYLLRAQVRAYSRPHPNRLDATVDPAGLPGAVRMLINTEWGYLSAISGLDPGAESGELEVLYHFCEGAAVVTLRVRVPREAARVPSLCAIIPSAGFFERELSEMFGVSVEGMPDPAPLFLPDEWPEGVYPLRKDYAAEPG